VIGVVDAMLHARLTLGDLFARARTPFPEVKPQTHTYAEGVQATLWTLGAALELRRCPEA
jgi:hypothetical protein